MKVALLGCDSAPAEVETRSLTAEHPKSPAAETVSNYSFSTSLCAKRKICELTTSGERVLAAYLQGPMAYVTTKLFQDATAAARRIQPS